MDNGSVDGLNLRGNLDHALDSRVVVDSAGCGEGGMGQGWGSQGSGSGEQELYNKLVTFLL